MTQKLILKCKNDVINNKKITKLDASKLFNVDDKYITGLTEAANFITRHNQGSKVDIEELANIKKNFCSEDCTFCSQSAFFNTKINDYQLTPTEQVVKQALNAKNDGANSFCLVAAWREPNDADFKKVCKIIDEINTKVGISIECSLGFLTETQARALKMLGVKRYNHNLEKSRSKFTEICSTHTYEDRVNTLEIARKAGLELCTGGIIGLGETSRFVVSASGYVGIGTDAPDSILHIESNQANVTRTMRFTHKSTTIAADDVIGRIEFEGLDLVQDI